KGFAYAGVQYSSECWCGNSYGRYGTSTNCNMTCSGDSTQICGGPWANDVYAVHSTPPVDGACGAANGVATATAPTSGLCNSGTASAVPGSGPFSWTCTGSGGGATASCSAPLLQASPPPPPPPPPGGVEVPGPSAALFNNPYYSCLKNYYVAA